MTELRGTSSGDVPSPDTFRTVAVATSERELMAAIAKHFAGPEDYVRVRQVGRYTWAADVARADTPALAP